MFVNGVFDVPLVTAVVFEVVLVFLVVVVAVVVFDADVETDILVVVAFVVVAFVVVSPVVVAAVSVVVSFSRRVVPADDVVSVDSAVVVSESGDVSETVVVVAVVSISSIPPAPEVSSLLRVVVLSKTEGVVVRITVSVSKRRSYRYSSSNIFSGISSSFVPETTVAPSNISENTTGICSCLFARLAVTSIVAATRQADRPIE